MSAHDLPAEPNHALLRLLLAGGPQAPRRRLLRQAGSPDAAVMAALQPGYPHGLSAAQMQALRQPDSARMHAALAWLDADAQHHLLGLGQPDYPALLALAPEPPLALLVKGDPNVLWHPCVAVVGSRAASASGRAIAAQLSQALCAAGLTVASGMAAGIDAAAHRAALAVGGRGLAVVGTGLDRCYPASHADLQRQLAEHGAVVSEYLPGTPPLAAHFPARNRILAGLCLGVLVVEAAQRSGAMITARLASEAGREVFAVPGSILNPQARGCHRLLRDGAGLVETVDDLLPALTPLAQRLAQPLRARVGPAPGRALRAAPSDARQHQVWQALEHQPIDLDELVQRTGLTVAGLSAILLDLEMAGWAVNEHGRYQRAPTPPTPTASTDAGRG